MTDTPMTAQRAESLLREYGDELSPSALKRIALTLAAELNQLRDDVTGACLARWEEEQDNARLRLAWQSARRGRKHLRDAVSAGPALPWAAVMADEDLEHFLNDLVSAAINHWQSDPQVPHRETLRLVEEACARWRTPGGWRSDASEIPAVFHEEATS